MQTSEMIEMLMEQSKEIAGEGHNGWGNTMQEAASALQKYVTAMDAIYNRNAACRAAVIFHFGLHHTTKPNTEVSGGGTPSAGLPSCATAEGTDKC